MSAKDARLAIGGRLNDWNAHAQGGLLVEDTRLVPEGARVAMNVQNALRTLEMRFEGRFCPALHAGLGGKSVPIHESRTVPCADVDRRTASDQSGFVLRRPRERIRLVHEHRVGEEHATTIARLAVGNPGPEA